MSRRSFFFFKKEKVFSAGEETSFPRGDGLHSQECGDVFGIVGEYQRHNGTDRHYEKAANLERKC